MFDLSDYDKESVEASRAVLLDALTVLGRYSNDIVIVGGWVPELRFPGKGHIGSIDADLAIRPGTLTIQNAYTTIRKLLLDAGYKQDPDLPNRFERLVNVGGKNIPVKLDLITGQQAGGDANRPEMIQELPVAKLRGVDLAFDFSSRIPVSGTLPDGGINRITAAVADARAYIAMKGITMWERKKEKDAYDIFFTLVNCGNDPRLLAEEFRKVLPHPLVAEGLSKIRAKFSSVDDIGPVWASQIVAQQGGDAELARRDAFERADALLNALGITAWTDGT
jgi:hypothetical protein